MKELKSYTDPYDRPKTPTMTGPHKRKREPLSTWFICACGIAGLIIVWWTR